MKDLMEALAILLTYGSPDYPTHCEHDELYVDIDPSLVSEEDLARLEVLGFHISDDAKGFVSHKFGSC